MAHIAHPGGPARIVYLGSPEIAVAPLKALVQAGHEVALVVTNPDRRRGRGKDLMPTPVKACAIELGLPVSHVLDDVLDVGAAFGVVVAYGHIIGSHVLDVLPMVNIHFSLLPRWRGAAPLERAILAGDETTGVCLMEIAEALDEGDVYARAEIPVANQTLDELRESLVRASCDLLVTELSNGLGTPEPQAGDVTYARKLKSDDFALDFSEPAEQLARVIRLGRAHTNLQGKRFAIKAASVHGEPCEMAPGALNGVRVATGQGWLVLETVQPEGKKPVAADDWRRGARIDPTTVLGA
ncbi:MAG: methionyl-tRNA formyltransferase [Acidimicrobiales bacterium]|jgi:methionyl-tRNA formyltransferase